MSIHPSNLAWKNLWTEEFDRLRSMVLQNIGHHWAHTHTHTHTHLYILHFTQESVLLISHCLQLFVTIGLQHTRLLCLTLSPRVCSNSCPLSQWCYLINASSASTFSFCLQSFPASESFSKSQLSTRWPKYCSFSFNISPSNEYSGLISFMIDWFDVLAIQGTLKSLLQHHSSKVSVWHSVFFMV